MQGNKEDLAPSSITDGYAVLFRRGEDLRLAGIGEEAPILF